MNSIKKHFNKQIKALQKAYNEGFGELEEHLLRDCIETIRDGKQIIASALGKNVPICEKFVGTLNSVGIDAHFVHTNSAIHGDLGVINDGDLVILLSKSGNTEETLVLAEIIRKFKIKNWLLTCNPDAKALKLVDNSIVFHLVHEGDPWNLIPNNSTILFLVFLQALAMTLIERLEIPLEVFKRNHPGGDIGRRIREIL